MMDNENNLNKWNDWYKNLPDNPSAFLYGDTISYKKAAEFLKDCKEVEDWGCGGGGFLIYRPDAIGVDGSDTKFAKKKFIDLKEYVNKCESIHMRHVLEHNYSWKEILNNALKSAKNKLVITMFIPLNNDESKEINHNKKYGVDVPDMSISRNEFMEIINSYHPKCIEFEKISSITSYGEEEIIYITL